MNSYDNFTSTPFVIRNASGDIIHGNVHLPEKVEGAPVVVLCHGFKGFKDWGFFPCTADRLAQEGWCAVRFNFSHNGVGEDFLNFTEMELFAKNTFSKELEDLEAVIQSVCEHQIIPNTADTKKLALLAHSRGGGIALIKASEDSRVKSIVTWASISTFDRWGEQTKRMWRENGFIEVINTRTKQIMRMNNTLLEDLTLNKKRLDISSAIKRLKKPLLIIHGEQDVSVPCEESRTLYNEADKSLTEIEIIPNTDHTFGIVHPLAEVTNSFGKVLQRTIFWLQMNTRE